MLSRKPVKDSVFSCNHAHDMEGNNVLGKTILTDSHRYTLWVKMGGLVEPLWEQEVAEELYDHTVDRQETHNVAQWDDYKQVKEQLKRRLKEGWKQALIQ